MEKELYSSLYELGDRHGNPIVRNHSYLMLHRKPDFCLFTVKDYIVELHDIEDNAANVNLKGIVWDDASDYEAECIYQTKVKINPGDSAIFLKDLVSVWMDDIVDSDQVFALRYTGGIND